MDISIKDFCENQQFFDLPTIQRGFVWKPYQIENLWDSLARNFPIGAFIADDKGKKIDEQNKLQILDGQQRASAIAIGYLGLGSNSLFNLHGNFIRLFIDIARPNENEGRKFTFRCITRSHPWGYKLKDNEEVLEVKDRRVALDIYEAKGIIDNDTKYYNVDGDKKKKFYPYDCFLPVPVDLFFENDIDIIENIIKYLKDNFGDFIIIKGNKVNLIKKQFFDDETEKYKMDVLPTIGLSKFYYSVLDPFKKKKNKSGIQKAYENKINELTLFNLADLCNYMKSIKNYYLNFSNQNNSKIEFVSDFKEIETKNNKVCTDDDIEIIFERLNTGGTSISADDLNYSLFKSSINNELLKNFEDCCENIISPALLLRISYLLYKNKNGKKLQALNFKLKDFKISLKEANNDFENFIQRNIINNNICMKIKSILLYYKDNKEKKFLFENNENGIPYVLLKTIIKRAPELFFMLAYRVLNVEKEMENLSIEKNRNKVIGIILCLYWFFSGEKRVNYKKLLTTIWQATNIDNSFEDCWSYKLFKRACLIYDNDNLEDIIFKDDAINFEFDDNELVMYAQRSALDSWFKEDDFNLEDNNVPFDIDHICPISFKRYAKKDIKKVINTIGNLRVWPYELNRFDKDDSADVKLYKKCNDKNLQKYGLKSVSDIKLFSFIRKKESWNEDYSKEKIGKGSRSNLHEKIIKRSQQIYEEWYQLIKEVVQDYNKQKDVIIPSKNKFTYHKKDILEIMKDVINETCQRIKFKDEYKEGEYEIELDFEDKNNIIQNDFFVIIRNFDNEHSEKAFSLTLCNNDEKSFERLKKELQNELKKYIEDKKK